MAAVDLPTLRLRVAYAGVARTLGKTGNSVMGDVRWSSAMPGGWDSFSCLIDDSERANNTNIYKYGARVTLYSDSGNSKDQVLWEGYLKTPVKLANGTCRLMAVGWQQLLAERDDPRLWLTYDGWVDMDSMPFDPYFNNADNIEAEASDRRAMLKVNKGTEIVPGDTARIGWWFSDHTVQYVAWSQTTNRANPTNGSGRDYSLRLERYDGPSSGASAAVLVTTDYTPTAAATNDAKTATITPKPMVAFRFRFEGTAKKDVQYDYKVRLTNLRVGGLIAADTYKAHEVMRDICGNGGTKFDTTTLVSTSSHDAMPYWHTDGPWTDIADDMAANEGGWKWGVWEMGTGGPQLEFRPWSSGTTWTAYAYGGGASAQWAIPDIAPADDVYSQVRVIYHIAGHERLRTVTKPTTASSLLSLDPPRIRTLEFELKNGQKNDAQAIAVAGRLASEYGTTQYGGSLYLSYATATTDKTAYLIRAGDQVTVPDFPLGSTTFRIVSTECDEKGVTLGLGRRHIRYHKRRKWLHGHRIDRLHGRRLP